MPIDTKPKAEFPTEQSLNTFIGIQTNAISIESTKALARFKIPWNLTLIRR